MGKMKWYWWLLVAIFALLGAWTLVPAPASKPSLLGYYVHCSFTPVSTINSLFFLVSRACTSQGSAA